MLGIATDDSHNYHTFGPDQSNLGRGWVQVKAKKLTPEALISAMESGDFYASTGVVLEAMETSTTEYKVKVKEEAGVSYRIQFIGARLNAAKSLVFEEVAGSEATYTFRGDELFIRVKIISDKRQHNPFQEGLEDTEVAWGQPVVSGKN